MFIKAGGAKLQAFGEWGTLVSFFEGDLDKVDSHWQKPNAAVLGLLLYDRIEKEVNQEMSVLIKNNPTLQKQLFGE